MKRKILTYAASTAMLSSLVLAGSAFATNNVAVTVQSVEIQTGSDCDQVSDFALKFDTGTVIQNGDQIEIGLDYDNATSNANLCRDVDIVIAPANDGDIDITNIVTTSTGWTNLNIPAEGDPLTTPSPITQVEDSSGAVVANSATDGGVIFRVHGTEGASKFYVDVIGVDVNLDADILGGTISSIDIGSDPGDAVMIKFFDQRVNASIPAKATDFVTDGIWVDGDADGVYETASTLSQNTLCLDSSLWTPSTIDAHISSGNAYSFNPSDPEIAHNGPAAEYSQFECTKMNCGDIVIGTSVQGGVATCEEVNNDDPTAGAYCDTGTVQKDNYLILGADTGFFELGVYDIEMQLMVDKGDGNGPQQTGTQGIYWTDDAVNVTPYATSTNICDLLGVAVPQVATYTNSAGGTVAVPRPANTADCLIEDTEKAVTLKTTPSDLGILASTHKYIHIKIPQMQYKKSEVNDGDIVSVKVILKKAPCSSIKTITMCLGTFVDMCNTVGVGNTITFPYFTGINDGADSYWDGIAISNMNDGEGDITYTLYESDGDISTYTETLKALDTNVAAMSMMNFTITTTGTEAGAGTAGDTPGYVTVTSEELTIDGFAMMGDNGTGQSMGYLPRQQ